MWFQYIILKHSIEYEDKAFLHMDKGEAKGVNTKDLQDVLVFVCQMTMTPQLSLGSCQGFFLILSNHLNFCRCLNP